MHQIVITTIWKKRRARCRACGSRSQKTASLLSLCSQWSVSTGVEGPPPEARVLSKDWWCGKEGTGVTWEALYFPRQLFFHSHLCSASTLLIAEAPSHHQLWKCTVRLVFEASCTLLCEVLNPGANWGSQLQPWGYRRAKAQDQVSHTSPSSPLSSLWG